MDVSPSTSPTRGCAQMQKSYWKMDHALHSTLDNMINCLLSGKFQGDLETEREISQWLMCLGRDPVVSGFESESV